jgi:hypothetical protein
VVRFLALALNLVMAGFWLLVSSHTLSEYGSEDQAAGIVIFIAVLATPVLSIVTMYWPPSDRARTLGRTQSP